MLQATEAISRALRSPSGPDARSGVAPVLSVLKTTADRVLRDGGRQ